MGDRNALSHLLYELVVLQSFVDRHGVLGLSLLAHDLFELLLVLCGMRLLCLLLLGLLGFSVLASLLGGALLLGLVSLLLLLGLLLVVGVLEWSVIWLLPRGMVVLSMPDEV